MLSNLWSDLRYGARAVFSRPTFAAVVMLTLALGIGVNVAMFSLAENALLLLGAIVAWALGLAVESLLFGVEAGDPLALAAATALLAAVMFGAAYIPARRASRVDPTTVLRHE